MADEKISAMPDAGALGGTEIIPLVSAGSNLSTTPGGGLLTYIAANISLAAARITSGQLALARGGTGADLSATGGANQIVRQNSAGGVFTVSALAAADIPNLDASKITTGTLAVARGGTNIGSYTIGDLLYASAAGVLSQLAGVATGNALISGGVATAPSWGKIGLATHISGTLAAANGGTGVANGASATLTLPNAATTITTGGTLALGGFTLTVPATGTAALLATANVFTAIQEADNNGIGTTSTDGLILANTTAAAVGAQQYSPRLRLTGQGWKTASTAASQAGDWTLETQLFQASVSPKPSLALRSQVNAGGYTTLLRMTMDTTNAPNASSDVGEFYFSSGGTRGLFLATNMSFVAGASVLGTGAQPTTDGGSIYGGTAAKFRGDTGFVGWPSGTDPSSSPDTAIKRHGAGQVQINNGTAGQWGSLFAGVRDTQVSAVINTLTLGHQISSGTVAAGHGIGVLLNLSTNNAGTPVLDQNAARWTAEWVVATNASQTGRAKHTVYDTAEREYLRGQASGSAPMIGFLGSAAVAQQTSGENLTNNVTSGGTDGTIANYTDLTVYANDAAAIRNDIYQLARKLKQVNDALRLYGLLT